MLLVKLSPRLSDARPPFEILGDLIEPAVHLNDGLLLKLNSASTDGVAEILRVTIAPDVRLWAGSSTVAQDPAEDDVGL